MMDTCTQWATLLSPVISVIAIAVALGIACHSSKDAKKQIKAIHNLLDVFVAANNLDIVEAQRKYQQQLADLDRQIKKAEIGLESVPRSDAIIDFMIDAQKKAEQKKYLNQLLAKRKEIEANLSLIQNYIDKTAR